MLVDMPDMVERVSRVDRAAAATTPPPVVPSCLTIDREMVDRAVDVLEPPITNHIAGARFTAATAVAALTDLIGSIAGSSVDLSMSLEHADSLRAAVDRMIMQLRQAEALASARDELLSRMP